ncbi:MAG: GNAT family N-acetyltransferase [Planctomycetes bacterium]|nr:GNAT family N-acetyltransferase [Planctomycetota bacterium]
MLHDLELARKLEAAHVGDGESAANAVRELFPEIGADFEPIAGGSAIYCGVGSYLTHALGLGIGRDVSDAELEALEQFYAERGSAIEIDLSPFADASLPARLSARGYRADRFEGVLVREITARDAEYVLPPDATFTIEEVSPNAADTYARVLRDGFALPPEFDDAMTQAGRTTAAMRSGRRFFAHVDGEPVGCGSVNIHGDVASLGGAATLPAFRRRGIQSALVGWRLRLAARSGATLCKVETLPGSASQRNMERLDFHPAYTRMVMIREHATES